MTFRKGAKYSIDRLQPPLLLNAVFLMALLLLLLNDHCWKYQYGNFLTGKLSDFAGLVLLPLYLAYLFPRLRERAVWVSAAFFLFWKSPLASPFIGYYNQLSPILITRVVDYTDYLAFMILPLPWWMIRKPQKWQRLQFSVKQNAWTYFVLLTTSISFIATSPPYWYRLSVNSGNVSFYKSPYKVKKSQAEILAKLDEENIDYKYYYRRDTLLLATSDFVVDSLVKNPHNAFLIPQLIIAEDTFYDLSFSLLYQAPDETDLLLGGMNVPGLTPDEIDLKMRRAYLKLLKKALVKTVRKE